MTVSIESFSKGNPLYKEVIDKKKIPKFIILEILLFLKKKT